MLSSSMLLLNLILLIDVTFSTPTGDCTSEHEENHFDFKLMRAGTELKRQTELEL
jgi:hypothetical protein